MTLIPIILTFISVAALTFSWLTVGLPGFVHLGYGLMTFCHSLFESCAEYKSFIAFGLLGIGTSLVGAGFVYGMVKNLSGLVRAERAVAALPKVDRGSSIVIIKDERGISAFTWGFLRPRIYLSTGLLSALTRAEVNAVCLHEVQHRRSADPLRFFLLNLLRDSFFYIPLIAQLTEHIRARKEFEADDYAAERAGEPVTLASALLKVSKTKIEASLASASFIGSGSPSDRIKRLIEGAEPGYKISVRTTALSFFSATFLIFALVLPLAASTAPAKTCVRSHCAMHARPANIGADSTAHCKTHKVGAGAHTH